MTEPPFETDRTSSGLPDSGALRMWVARSTAAGLLARAVAMLATLVMTPIVLGFVGVEAFALYTVAAAIVGYATLLDLGIAGALTKYVAEHVRRGELESASTLVGTALWLYMALGALVAVLGIAAAAVIPGLIGLRPDQRELATTVVALLGLGAGVAIPAAAPSAVLKGLGRFDLVARVRIVGSIASALATFIVLERGFGIVGMAALSVPLIVGSMMLATILLRAAAPWLRVPRPTRSLIPRIVSFSGPLVVLDIAGRLQSESDEIVIATLLPLASVTPFAIAARVSGIARSVTEQFAAVLLPLASSLEAASDRARLQETFIAGTRVTLAAFLPVAIGLVVLAERFLRAWIGPELADAAPIVIVLVLAAGFDMVMWPAGFVLQGIRRHHRIALIALASGIANVVLSVLLSGPLGIFGVALGTLLASSVECVLFVQPYAAAQLAVPARRIVSEVVVPATIPAVPAAFAVWALGLGLEPSSIPAIAFAGAIGVAVYGAVYLAMRPARQERALLLGALRGAGAWLGQRG